MFPSFIQIFSFPITPSCFPSWILIMCILMFSTPNPPPPSPSSPYALLSVPCLPPTSSPPHLHVPPIISPTPSLCPPSPSLPCLPPSLCFPSPSSPSSPLFSILIIPTHVPLLYTPSTPFLFPLSSLPFPIFFIFKY